MSLRRLLSLCLLGFAVKTSLAADYLAVRGSSTVARVFEVAAEKIKQDVDVDFRVAVDSSSIASVINLQSGVIDLALIPRMLTPEERSERPNLRSVETVIGYQALAVIVSEELWKAGIKTLSRQQLRQIYEREVSNWKELGGPDRAIEFYNRESTYGVWDLYMIFLYGELRKAPLSKADALDNAREAKSTVEFNTGSISFMELGAYKEGDGVRAVAIKKDDGTSVEPSPATIANQTYPIMRPLVMVSAKAPTGKLRALFEYMQGAGGQDAVRKAGHIAVADLPKK